MSVYRIGDIIRMKREALELTREQLCEKSEEICGEQTLYRIESGKVKVNRKKYSKLMKGMQQIQEKNYSSIMVSDYRVLNIKSEIQVLMVNREYEEAEKKVEELKKYMKRNYVRNEQYLIQIKSKMDYYQNNISAGEHLKNLLNALSYTVPDVEKLRKWPLNENEFEIAREATFIYQQMGCNEEAIKLLLKLNENTERDYIEKKYAVFRKMQCSVALSQSMSQIKEHEQALEYCKRGIEEIRNTEQIGVVYNLLYDIVWNKEYLIRKGLLEKEERKSCKKNLIQAYYLSVAQGNSVRSKRIKELCEQLYPEIELLD